MISVVLADDQQMFIDGLRVLLEKHNDINIVGEATNGHQVINILKNQPVDIVVLDIEMPEQNGIETTKIIKKDFPNSKVLILSMYDKKEYILKLMQHGASGYILKNKSKEELLMAIRNVAAGNSHYGLEVMNHAISTSNLDKDEEIQLTEREVEVLIKIAEGYTSKEAADLLFITERTVNTHRRNIMLKLDLPSGIHLTRYAIKHGYVKL